MIKKSTSITLRLISIRNSSQYQVQAQISLQVRSIEEQQLVLLKVLAHSIYQDKQFHPQVGNMLIIQELVYSRKPKSTPASLKFQAKTFFLIQYLDLAVTLVIYSPHTHTSILQFMQSIAYLSIISICEQFILNYTVSMNNSHLITIYLNFI